MLITRALDARLSGTQKLADLLDAEDQRCETHAHNYWESTAWFEARVFLRKASVLYFESADGNGQVNFSSRIHAFETNKTETRNILKSSEPIITLVQKRCRQKDFAS